MKIEIEEGGLAMSDLTAYKQNKCLLVSAIIGIAAVALAFLGCEKTANKSSIATTPNTVVAIPSDNQETVNYEVDFEPVIEFHGEAFPVKALATASRNTSLDGSPRMKTEGDYIGDVFGDFGVTLTIKGDAGGSVQTRVEVEGDRFIKKSLQEAVVPTNTSIEVFPRIMYDYPALERLNQPAMANVTFRLYIANTLVKETTEVVRFHSVNEVPLAEISRRDGETIINHKWLFAAYVNEEDPLIDKILQEALEIGTVEKIGWGDSFSFGGYQDRDGDGDPSLEVQLQVLAVWSVFQRRNIKYSNITTTSTANQAVATQYVRTLEESYSNSQANCVDGTVLFASVLRKLGIEPFLVLIPGHMFLGYFLDDTFESINVLETTMLGSVDLSKVTKDDSWWGKFKNWIGMGKTQSSVSRDSFLAASDAAWSTWEEVKDKIKDDSEEDYYIIPIAASRAAGVMPIKRYTNGEDTAGGDTAPGVVASGGDAQSAHGSLSAGEYVEKGDFDTAPGVGASGGDAQSASGPLSAEEYFKRGESFFEKNDYDTAIAEFSDAIRLKPDYAAAYARRGNVYRLRGMKDYGGYDKEDWDRAIADCTQAIRLDPKYAPAYIYRGNIYYDKSLDDRDKSMLDLAIADYTQLIRLKPDDADAYRVRGEVYLHKGDYDRAIADCTQAIRLNPDAYDAYYTRSQGYFQKKDWNKVIVDCTEAIRLFSESKWGEYLVYTEAYNDRGVAYFWKGDYDKAIEDYNTAINHDPDYALGYANLAWAYLEKGDYDRAISYCNQAINLDPNLSFSYRHRGFAYMKKGDYAKARTDFEKALQIDPDYTLAREGLEELRKNGRL
jgi:tetratricopeptide (TPR) repeat protein